MCEFFENPDLIATLHDKVPVSMPPAPGAWGFDIPLCVGLGTVGLWAALDAFSERASLGKPKCPICKGRRIPARFPGVQGKDAPKPRGIRGPAPPLRSQLCRRGG
jgi:hypothetical protein